MGNAGCLRPTYLRAPSLAAGRVGVGHGQFSGDVRRVHMAGEKPASSCLQKQSFAETQPQPEFPFQIQHTARLQRDWATWRGRAGMLIDAGVTQPCPSPPRAFKPLEFRDN